MPPFHVVIPARYASTRLPGKPLLDIAGLPMLIRVYRQAAASGASSVTIATDDERIAEVARQYEAACEMTAPGHESGTDRVAEIAIRRGWQDDQIVVNVQGDEPLIPPELIDQVAGLLARNGDAAMSTLCTAFASEQEFGDQHTAKVVVDHAGYALYFSRSTIPSGTDGTWREHGRRHIGLYAYRVGPLMAIAAAEPCAIELTERLEQLRALWLGYKIIVGDAAEQPAIGVDTREDLETIRRIIGENLSG